MLIIISVSAVNKHAYVTGSSGLNSDWLAAFEALGKCPAFMASQSCDCARQTYCVIESLSLAAVN